MSPIALALLLALGAEPAESIVRVSPGAQQVLRVGELVRVAIANPEVADVHVTGSNELLILGRRSGKTTLTLWTRKTKTPVTRLVVVDDGSALELEHVIKDKVSPSLKVQQMDEKILVEGTLDSMDAYARLRALTADEPRVKLMVRLDPAVLPAVARKINEALAKQGIAEAKAEVMGQRIVLTGSVSDSEERQRAQIIADSFYSDLAH